MAIKVLGLQIQVMPDDNANGSADDPERYSRGDVDYVGVRAVVYFDVAGTEQKIKTPGIWGIEGDSGDDYFLTVGEDEYGVLKDIVEELGLDFRLPSFSRAKLIDRR